MSIKTRTRVINLWMAKYCVDAIVHCLNEEGVSVSRTAIYEFIKKLMDTKVVCDLSRAPQPRKLEEIHYRFIDDEMAINSNLTSRQLHAIFSEKFPSVDVSLSTIKRSRFELGWVSKRVRYCQLIREVPYLL